MEKFVLSIQINIYDNTKAGDTSDVHEYQNKLINHGAAKLLAVLRVTQENKGRNTLGIDNFSSKDIRDRIEYAKNLYIDDQASKVKRVWID